jgi:hypothetical protein
MLFERVRQNVRFKPVHSLAALFLADSSTIMVIHSVISGLGAEFSSEFAIAFAMARLVRRFRLPADLLTAGIISKRCHNSAGDVKGKDPRNQPPFQWILGLHLR